MKKVKFQVFCPRESVEAVRLAIGKAGGGKFKNYDYCCFVSEGKGYFRPLQGAHPAIGTIGEITEVEEVKIECMCDEADIPAILAAVRVVHPYEEIAYDVIPLALPEV